MKSKKIVLLLAVVFFSFFLVALKANSVKAASPVVNLTQKETYGYVTQAGIRVDVNNNNTDGKILKVLCYSAGEKPADFFDNCDKTPMKLEFTKEDGDFLYHSEFMANLNGVYTVYARTWYDEVTLSTITVSNIDSTADTIVLTQGPVNDKLNNVIINIQITNSESDIEEVKYMSGRRSLEEIRNYGTKMEEYDKLVANNLGYYTFYVKDKAKNEAVAYINVVASTIVNGKKKVGLNQASQIKYLVKEKDGVYYIELPKLSDEAPYPKNKVMILSTYDSESNQYKVVEKTQGYKQYVVMEGDTYSALKKDRVIVTVDHSVIGAYEEGNTYVYANFVSKKQARSLGFNVTIRNFNYALLALGVVAILFILFIISRLRVKRFSAN